MNPKLIKLYKFLMLFFDRVDKNHLFMLASAIAFNVLLYQIPFLFLTLYLLNIFGIFDNYQQEIQKMVTDFLPPTLDAQSYLAALFTEVNKIIELSGFFGIIGVFVLIWISSSLISGIRYSLNMIFKISMPSIFLIYKVRDSIIVLSMTFVIFLYTFIVPVINFFKDLLITLIPAFFTNTLFENGYFLIIGNLITGFIFFFLIYKFLPTRKINKDVLLFATTLSTIVIEITRHIFAYYLMSLSNFGKFYGAFAMIVSMALWIYYSALILLLSAEFSQLYLERKNIIKLDL